MMALLLDIGACETTAHPAGWFHSIAGCDRIIVTKERARRPGRMKRCALCPSFGVGEEVS
jgi:hypothetical protein